MIQLTVDQLNLVSNTFSFTIGALAITTVFFFLQRREVAPRYRLVVTILGLVTMIAAYSYFRLLEKWTQAFTVVNGVAQSTGLLYDDSYRYADWLLAVPLLLMCYVLSLDLPQKQARSRSIIFALLAVDMIVTGYPGQVATTTDARLFWWAASMLPYALIILQFYVGLAPAIRRQPAQVRSLVVNARTLTVLIWCFYPVVYVLPLLDIGGTNAFIGIQIGYAVADIVAKAGYGLILYAVVMKKSQLAEQAMLPPPDAQLRPVRTNAGFGEVAAE